MSPATVAAASSAAVAAKHPTFSLLRPLYRTIVMLLLHPITSVRTRMRSGLAELSVVAPELPRCLLHTLAVVVGDASASMETEVHVAHGSGGEFSVADEMQLLAHADSPKSDPGFVFPARPLPNLIRFALNAIVPDSDGDAPRPHGGAGGAAVAKKRRAPGASADVDFHAPDMVAQALLLCSHPAVVASDTEARQLWKSVRACGSGSRGCAVHVAVGVSGARRRVSSSAVIVGVCFARRCT